MRSGRLLAEECPHALLSMFACTSLEDVFLKLSRKQVLAGHEQIISNNINLASPNQNIKDVISVTEERGVIGLNSHQNKEVTVTDSNVLFDVRMEKPK